MGEGISPCGRRGRREPRARGRILICAAALVGLATRGLAVPPAGDGHDDQITAAEIHARLIANRFDSKILEATLLSQRDGRYQPIRIQVL